MMSITGKDLALKLNLSEAAISMALHNKPGVSTSTRKKVLEAAHQYGYDFTSLEERSPNPTCSGSIHFIIFKKCGAIVADTPFFSELTEGINKHCKEAHYTLNMSYIYENDDIEQLISNLNVTNYVGIILLGTEMIASDLKPFLNLKVPFIVLDTYFDTLHCNYVLINNHQGAFNATQYLIRQCHSQPGYLQSSYEIANFVQRSNGFYNAIRSNGLSPFTSIVHQLTPSIEGAFADMCAILSRKDEIASCYFADNDLIACGAIKAFKSFGYKIPEDISIIGFDDIPLCSYIDPSLTTISVPKEYMGKLAVTRLVDLIHIPQPICTKTELDTTLMIRNSVK